MAKQGGRTVTKWKKKGAVDWTWAWRGVRVFAWLVLLGGLVAAWHFGVPQLERLTRQHQPDGPVRVEFLNPPAWFHGDVALSLSLTIQEMATADPYDQQQLHQIAETLQASGWFETVNQVRRTEANVIQIDAKFVRPFAMIRGDDADILVDPVGRRLPMQVEHGEAHQFIVITGAEFSQPPRLGEHWPGSDVIAGLQLLRLIDAVAWRTQVTAVDVESYRRHRTVEIVTDRDVSINFEHAPGEEEPLELPAAQKMQMLSYNYRMHGHISGAQSSNLRFSGGTLYSQR